MKVLVTGGSGFVGSNLKSWLSDYSLVYYQRSRPSVEENWFPGALSEIEKFPQMLTGVSHVIHMAARAHIMNEVVANPLEEFREVNTQATLNLAEAAAQNGVKRFIYLSSIKVHGERNHTFMPIDENSQLDPVDPYGVSKFEAEQGLRKIAAETGMEVVIIRPPLVYGPGVKANFGSMLKWLNKNKPLPLGAVHNRRSLVGIDNLCNFIKLCVVHPSAANETFLVSDQDDVSTTELLTRLKIVMKSSSLILPVPTSLMRVGANLIGKGTLAQRLFDNLFVTSDKATRLLGWTPPFTMQEQLQKTADHFLQR